MPVAASARSRGWRFDATLRGACTRHGGADALEVRGDWPAPEPGPTQVLVRVTALAVNNTDIWTREGSYGLPGDPGAKSGWRGPIRFPRVQGGDIAGEVAHVGAEVSPGLVGRRVLVDPALYCDATVESPPVGLPGSKADGGSPSSSRWTRITSTT